MKKKTAKKSKGATQINPKKKPTEKKAEKLEFIRFTALPRVFRDKEWGFNSDADFANKFRVNPGTLVEWKKDSEFIEGVMATLRSWGKDRLPDVLAGLYKKAIKDGTASEVKLWLQYFDDWKEKSDVNLYYAALKDLQDVNRAIFERGKKESRIKVSEPLPCSFSGQGLPVCNRPTLVRIQYAAN